MMKFFKLNLNRLANVSLIGKEHFTNSRVHVARRIDCYIFYVITEGELSLLHNGTPLILKSGDACLFSPGDTQKPLGKSECKYYYVHFDAELNAFDLDTSLLAEEIRKKNIAFADQYIYSKTQR